MTTQGSTMTERHQLAVALNAIFYDSPGRITSYFSLFESWTMFRENWGLVAAQLSDRLLDIATTRFKAFNLDRLLQVCEDKGVHLLYWDSPYYPSLLKELSDAPPVLYVKGQLATLQADCLAVVGSRRMTEYGRKVTVAFVSELVSSFVIVSGLAHGVDGTAHQVTLDQGGRTIAVVATGLDVMYPSAHRELSRSIIERGAILSEYPLGTDAAPYRFPQRNRLISGLSRGVLVTESAIKGGAMLTASEAVSQNRDVFAVPGSVFNELSDGTHHLIRQGGKCVTHPKDILKEYTYLPLPFTESKRPEASVGTWVAPVLEPAHQVVYDALAQAHELNDLVVETGYPVHVLLPILTLLELNGHIELVPGNRYQRCV